MVKGWLSFRSSQQQDREIVFPGKATADQNWSSSIYTSKVYSPHRQNLDVDIDMDVFSNVTVSAGGGLEIMERTKREVEKTRKVFCVELWSIDLFPRFLSELVIFWD